MSCCSISNVTAVNETINGVTWSNGWDLVSKEFVDETQTDPKHMKIKFMLRWDCEQGEMGDSPCRLHIRMFNYSGTYPSGVSNANRWPGLNTGYIQCGTVSDYSQQIGGGSPDYVESECGLEQNYLVLNLRVYYNNYNEQQRVEIFAIPGYQRFSDPSFECGYLQSDSGNRYYFEFTSPGSP
jgi:hypothetical protein